MPLSTLFSNLKDFKIGSYNSNGVFKHLIITLDSIELKFKRVIKVKNNRKKKCLIN